MKGSLSSRIFVVFLLTKYDFGTYRSTYGTTIMSARILIFDRESAAKADFRSPEARASKNTVFIVSLKITTVIVDLQQVV